MRNVFLSDVECTENTTTLLYLLWEDTPDTGHKNMVLHINEGSVDCITFMASEVTILLGKLNAFVDPPGGAAGLKMYDVQVINNKLKK